MLPTPLLTDLTMALDPARLFRRAVGDAPDPWQVQVLRSDAQQVILNCSRQAGKSTTTACLCLHAALYQAPALVLVVTPTLRQSQELFKKIVESYRAVAPVVGVTAESALRLELANGSRIIALPGDATTIRGYSAVTLLVIDEASQVPDDLYLSVRPMLAVSNGRIVLLSSPFGRRGFFHAEWATGGAAWERYEVPATEVPRISAAFLESERRSLGPVWFSQEYSCAFIDPENSVFSFDDIEQAVSPHVKAVEW